MSNDINQQRQFIRTQPRHAEIPQQSLDHASGSPPAVLGQRAPAVPQLSHSIISVEEAIRHVRRYWVIAMLVGLSAGIGVFVHLQSQKPVYESTAAIVLLQSTGRDLNLQTMKPAEPSEYNLPELVNNMRIELDSDKFRLSLYRTMPEELRKKVIGTMSPLEKDLGEQACFLGRLDDQINIETLKDSHIVALTAKHHDNIVAAELANAYVHHFVGFVAAEELVKTRKVSEFLKSKADGLLANVRSMEAELLQIRKNEGVVSMQTGTDLASNMITNLNTQLVAAKLKEEQLQDTLFLIDQIDNNPEELLKVPALAENDVLAGAYAKLVGARENVAALSMDFRKRHPNMLVAVSQEALALDNLGKLVTQSVGSLRRQLQTTQTKVRGLERKVDVAMTEIVATSNKSIGHQLKEQQLKDSRDLYSRLVKQMNEADIALQFEGANHIRVTEQAMVQSEPVLPRKSLSAVLGSLAFASCFFGIPLMLGFGQRVLALGRPKQALPACLGPESQIDQPHYPTTRTSLPTLAFLPMGNVTEPREWLRRVTDTATPSGSALKRFVDQSLNAGVRARGLVITSGHTETQKTLTAAAISLAASQEGLRTLLVSGENMVPIIETDLREASNTPGDGQQLKSVEKLLQPFTTTQNNLYYITEDAWKSLPALCLEALSRAEYCVDLIVLDAPLVTDEAHLKVMSNFASQCVFVRGEYENYDYADLQAKFQRSLPNCTLAGEFVLAGE